jgi:hypothetical protein
MSSLTAADTENAKKKVGSRLTRDIRRDIFYNEQVF